MLRSKNKRSSNPLSRVTTLPSASLGYSLLPKSANRRILDKQGGFGRFKAPKDDEKLCWTMHVVQKMMYYGISEGLVRRVIHTPSRTEEGVAPGTIAVMQPTGGTHKKEAWVMYQPLKVKTKTGKPKLRVITAWRYPGVSPVRSAVPIPNDILLELMSGEDVSFELPQ